MDLKILATRVRDDYEEYLLWESGGIRVYDNHITVWSDDPEHESILSLKCLTAKSILTLFQ